MGEPLPDEVYVFFQEHWSELGFTPVLLYRLAERGWEYGQIDKVLTIVIGADYNKVKATTWIDRLEDLGVEFPEDDSIPFIEILDKIMFVTIATGNAIV